MNAKPGSKLSELKTYVVSVTSFGDRQANISKQAKEFGLDIEFIWDYDVDKLTEEDLARVDEKKLPRKSVSTVLKHLEAQRRLLASGDRLALVLEDDAILFAQFSIVLNQILTSKNLPSGPFLLFVGGADNKATTPFLKASPTDLIEHPLSTAEAYIIEQSAAQKRLDWCAEHRIDKPADHFLASIDQKLGITHYWTGIPLATQGSITGQFKTSLDDSRAKHSLFFLWVKYRYNRWRRQILPRIYARLLHRRRKNT